MLGTELRPLEAQQALLLNRVSSASFVLLFKEANSITDLLIV